MYIHYIMMNDNELKLPADNTKKLVVGQLYKKPYRIIVANKTLGSLGGP